MKLKNLARCFSVGVVVIWQAGRCHAATIRLGTGSSFAYGPWCAGGGAARRARGEMAIAAPPRRGRISVPMAKGYPKAKWPKRDSGESSGVAVAEPPAAAAAATRQSAGGASSTAGTAEGREGDSKGAETVAQDLPFFDYRHLGLDQPRACSRRPEMTMLEELGRAKLLTAAEERQLGRKVQVLMVYEEARRTLEAALERAPTDVEWAIAVGEASEDSLHATVLDGTAAKHIMVRSNMRLVVAIAKRYYHGTIGLQDLVQEGSLGLIRAAEKYDPERGFKFSTYAAWWIQQAIFKSIAYHSRLIRLPMHVHNVLNSSKRVRRDLVAKLGRSPSEAEVAEGVGIPLEKLRRYWRANRKTLSTEVPTGRAFGVAAQQEWVLGDILESKDTMAPEVCAEMRLFRNSLQQIVQGLPDEERRVVTLRYGLDDGRIRTLQEIAEISRCSKDWVRKMETRALRKLRSPEHQERLVQFLERLSPLDNVQRPRRRSSAATFSGSGIP